MNIAWRLEPGTDLWIWRRMKRACKMNWSFGRFERIDLITAGFTWYMTFFIKGECWTKSQKALFRYFIHIRQAQRETLQSESVQSWKCKIFYFTDMTFFKNGECAKLRKLYSSKDQSRDTSFLSRNRGHYLKNEIKEKEPSAKPTEEGLGEQMKGSPVALRRGNWSLWSKRNERNEVQWNEAREVREPPRVERRWKPKEGADFRKKPWATYAVCTRAWRRFLKTRRKK